MTIQPFSEFVIEEGQFKQFCEDIDRVLSSDNLLIEEELVSKSKMEFIKELSATVKMGFREILTLFKDKIVYNIFNAIKWSLKTLYRILKKGYDAWGNVHEIIAKFISDNKITKFTAKHLDKLDAILHKDSRLAKVTGILVGGFLIFQWTSLISFTGNVKFDFSQETLLDALKGKFSLSQVLASPAGVKMLMFIGTGITTGVSFPWPALTGSGLGLFLFSIIYTVTKNKRKELVVKLKKKFNIS